MLVSNNKKINLHYLSMHIYPGTETVQTLPILLNVGISIYLILLSTLVFLF